MIKVFVNKMPEYSEECSFAEWQAPSFISCLFNKECCNISKCKFLTTFEDKDDDGFIDTRPHWIDIWKNDTSTEAQCSVCSRYSNRPVGRFCKWCGAKMSDEEDGYKLNSAGIIRKAIGEDI